ncbi:hypothetical protein [Stigmatella aurantiaca]|uniref:hypothetical protein n=1 Tax=Stigmatella aurantiaca TaxID=41 RepID=UPI000A6C4687|nr:hypothetical protein [Stigmatella aurantiaca]
MMPYVKEIAPLSVLIGALMLAPNSAQAANESCNLPAGSNEMVCPLRAGTFTFTVPKFVHVRLNNSTGSYLQIDQVQGQGPDAGGFGEYGVFLNLYATAQTSPGKGEVGTGYKDSGPGYPPIRWDSTAEATGLSVPPGSTVYLDHNWQSGAASFTYTVTSRPQTTGVSSWRQPQADQVISCNGTRQQTTWGPWKNTTAANYYLRGAQIYVSSGKPVRSVTDSACLYILDTTGNVRWHQCDGVNVRGRVAVSSVQVVRPGESVAAQAANTCPVGAVWDWVAYMYISR